MPLQQFITKDVEQPVSMPQPAQSASPVSEVQTSSVFGIRATPTQPMPQSRAPLGSSDKKPVQEMPRKSPTTDGPTTNPLSDDDQMMLCALSAMQIRYGRPAEAISYLMMVRKVNPENTEAIRLLALTFMRLKRWNEAEVMLAELETLQEADGSLASNGMIYLYKSVVSLKTRGLTEARSFFNKFRSFIKTAMQGSAS